MSHDVFQSWWHQVSTRMRQFQSWWHQVSTRMRQKLDHGVNRLLLTTRRNMTSFLALQSSSANHTKMTLWRSFWPRQYALMKRNRNFASSPFIVSPCCCQSSCICRFLNNSQTSTKDTYTVKTPLDPIIVINLKPTESVYGHRDEQQQQQQACACWSNNNQHYSIIRCWRCSFRSRIEQY